MVDLSVVVVSWNVCDLLQGCLSSMVRLRSPQVVQGSTSPTSGERDSVEDGESLGPKPPSSGELKIEVIVVDNASTDGSPDMVRSEFPDVRLIANDRNCGFTAANNQGLAQSHGQYLLLLNPDTEVVGDALATMIGYMDAHPEVGALGPRLRYPDGSLQSSRRRFPSLGTALVESTVIQEWWTDNRLLRRYYMADTPDDAIQPVDWVVGACLLARRQVYEQVGGLDEGFFMYSEELDWCRRIKDAGWEVVYLPTATVIHHEGKSSEQVVPARHIYFQSSKVRYYCKHHGAFQAEVLRWFLMATYVFQWVREGLKWLVGHKRPLREGRLWAYGQVLRSGLRTPPIPTSVNES
jgi:GT2 family glycosyltransferase